MLTTSITDNPHFKKLHQSVVDEVLGLAPKNVALTLEWANILDMDPVDYEKLIDNFLQLPEVDQNSIMQDIILGYTAAHTRREAIERMKQLPTSSNSVQSPTKSVTI